MEVRPNEVNINHYYIKFDEHKNQIDYIMN